MPDLCVKCNKKPVAIKKSKLCKYCYQKERREERREKRGKHEYPSEMDFIKNFFTHNNWIYEPVVFRLNETRYTPDFYDGERNVFIEVVGTRQAYHKNREKYQSFREMYPKINFEIRTTDGKILNEKEKRT